MILVRIGSLLVVLLILTMVVFVIQSVLPADPVAPPSAARRATRSSRPSATSRLRPAAPSAVRQLPRQRRAGRLRGLAAHPPAGARGHLEFRCPRRWSCVHRGVLRRRPRHHPRALVGARRSGSGVARVTMLVLSSAPAFFLAILLILLFYRNLGWLPASGRMARSTPTPGRPGSSSSTRCCTANPASGGTRCGTCSCRRSCSRSGRRSRSAGCCAARCSTSCARTTSAPRRQGPLRAHGRAQARARNASGRRCRWPACRSGSSSPASSWSSWSSRGPASGSTPSSRSSRRTSRRSSASRSCSASRTW